MKIGSGSENRGGEELFQSSSPPLAMTGRVSLSGSDFFLSLRLAAPPGPSVWAGRRSGTFRIFAVAAGTLKIFSCRIRPLFPGVLSDGAGRNRKVRPKISAHREPRNDIVVCTVVVFGQAAAGTGRLVFAENREAGSKCSRSGLPCPSEKDGYSSGVRFTLRNRMGPPSLCRPM